MRASGLIPILAHKMDDIEVMADAIRSRIERAFPDLREAMNDPETLKEATIIFEVNGVMCRSRIDIPPTRTLRLHRGPEIHRPRRAA